MKLSQRRLARPSLGGMLATRQGSLTLALVCAACAAAILVFALGRYKTSLKTPVTQASVLVATAQIPKGTSGSAVAAQRLYKVVPMVTSQVTPGALVDAAAIANETAATDILPGQQLTATDFAGLTSVAETLSPNQRAVSVSTSEAPGNTDVVQPGDHVDVYVGVLPKAFSPTGSSTDSASDVAIPFISDVLVLKAGTPAPVKRDGVTITGNSMVLAVDSSQVQLLITAALKGAIYLSLRPPNASPTPSDQYANALARLSTSAISHWTSVMPTLLPTTHK